MKETLSSVAIILIVLIVFYFRNEVRDVLIKLSSVTEVTGPWVVKFGRRRRQRTPILTHRVRHGRAVTATAGASAAIILLAVGFIAFRYRTVRVTHVFDAPPLHLGDNIFVSSGAVDPPGVPDPRRQEYEGVVFFDKERGVFESTQLPADQERILKFVAPLLAKYRFDSYKHVALLERAGLTARGLAPVPSPRVAPLGGGTFATWLPNEGNLHLEKAAVLANYRADLKPKLIEKWDSGAYALTKAVLVLEISHAGPPSGMGGEVFVLVNGCAHKLDEDLLNTPSLDSRTFQLNVLDCLKNFEAQSYAVSVSVVVLPIREATPVSPDGLQSPVHFRDIMINSVRIILEVRRG